MTKRKIYQCPYDINAICSMDMPCIECDDFNGLEAVPWGEENNYFDEARKIIQSWPDWRKEYKL